jgi:hypothetical protein
MMPRGGYPFEENSFSPGALRFDSDNRTFNHHFRQQFIRQQAADRWLATAATLSADFNFCNSEYASGRRLATAAALSAKREHTG